MNLDQDTLPTGMEERVEVMALSLFNVENNSLEKVMETLTLKGVIIRFPTRIKSLELTQGLDHLI